MQGTRAIGLFCDDIREERSEQDTIIGIMPDNMTIGKFPSLLPKLGIYIRVHIDPQSPPSRIAAKLKTPWDENEIGGADHALIQEAAKQSIQRGLPISGIVLKAVVSPFRMQSPGLVSLTVSIDGGDDTPCALLNLLPAASSI
jgi:hypothetical protein